MRRRLTPLSIALALLASCSARGPDPVVVDPKHYKVEFENERFRVLHVTIGPHEKTPMHYHPDYLIMILTENHARATDMNGAVSEGNNTRGTAAGTSLVHSEENLSDTPMERYIVELKKR